MSKSQTPERRRELPPSETSPLLTNAANRSNSYHHGDGDNDITPSTPPNNENGHVTEMPPMSRLVPILATIWVPVFVASLDGTVVATLVGSISSSFEAAEQASWLGTSYLLSLCCFNPLVGRLADVFGRRVTLLVSIALFTAGTLGCGAAPSFQWFLIARVVAGAGGGGLTTTGNIIMSDIIPLRNRGLMQGATNILFGLGSGLGGPVGGFCNDLIGWRNAFYIQVPFLAIAFLLAIKYIHDRDASSNGNGNGNNADISLSIRTKLRRIDFSGSFTLVGCVAFILIPLSLVSGDDYSFSNPLVYGLLLAGILSGLAFVLIQLKLASHPVLPMRLLSHNTGIGVAISNFSLSVTSFATLYTFPLYFQAVRLESASQAGLHLIPYSVALSISSVTAGIYMRQTGRFKKYNAIMSSMQLVSAIFFYTLTPHTPEWATYLAIVPMGVGGAGILTCTLIAIINAVPRSDIAVSTAMTYLFRSTGQVLGVSLSGTILQFGLKTELHRRIEDLDLIEQIRHSSTLIPKLPLEIREAASQAYYLSLRKVFLFLALVSIVTVASSCVIEDKVLPELTKASDDGREAQRRGERD